MKKLFLFLTAGLLAFGFFGCSNLHDVSNNPYTATEKVYVLGGISASKIDTTVYKESAFADTKAYEIKVEDGKVSFEFTYSGSDSWSAGDGKTAFAIVADVSADWAVANACRWQGNGDIAVGTTGNLSKGSGNNIVISSLSAGTVYKFTADLTDAGGEMSVEAGLAAVPFELIWVDNESGNLTNAVSITAESDKKFSYVVVPEAKARTYKFIARYGNDYYFPATEVSFDTNGKTAEAEKKVSSDGFAPLSVEIPSASDSEKVHFSSYKISIELSDDRLKTTCSAEGQDVMPYLLKWICSSLGNYNISWSEPKDLGSGISEVPYRNEKIYTANVTIPKEASDVWSSNGKAIQFGVTDNTSWTTKYTGATLIDTTSEQILTAGASKNNEIAIVSGKQESDIVISLKYTIYEDTFKNNGYNDEVKLTASYTGSGEIFKFPAFENASIKGSDAAKVSELEFNMNKTEAFATVQFPADYKDNWNENNEKTFCFGFLGFKEENWYNAWKGGEITLDSTDATKLKAGEKDNNKVVSTSELAGKTIKLTFKYIDEDTVECKATAVQ